jgi:methionyl-tRNA formyltransferase
MRTNVRIVFLGTPEFAVPTLEALAKEHEIALVVAQPDKPSGRGMKMHAPAVAMKAKELGIPLVQPPKIREGLDAIRAAAPEIGIVVAYGKILPPALLEIPKHGFLNVHGSILPKYRGAAPIQRAIEHGETETGVTIMRVDEELDHGAMLSIARTPIGPDERTPDVASRLSRIGAEAMVATLRGPWTETPQDHSLATFAPKIEKGEGSVSWSEPARVIYDKFRAFYPWPGVFAGELKLIELARVDASDDGVVVQCGEGALRVISVQRPGKSPVRAIDFVRGGGKL